MRDGEFVLTESHAILRYLCEKFGVADHWYPKEMKKRAKMDQYLDWHHTYLRYGCAGLVFKTHFGPKFFKLQYSEEEVNQAHIAFKSAMTLINTWLSTQKYICGDQISIADLLACCEIWQLGFIQKSISEYPHVQTWFQNIKKVKGI